MKINLIRYLNQALSTFFILVTISYVSAQHNNNNNNKIYTSDLDSLWSRSTNINKLTIDGNWVVLTEVFDQKENVIFLKHTTDTITFKFPDSQWIRFSDNSQWFGCITSKKELNLINLEKRSKETYQDIYSYDFSKSGDYVATFQKSKETTGTLSIIDLNKKNSLSIKDIVKYKWHPKQNRLLLTINDGTTNKVTIYNVDDSSYNVISKNIHGIYDQIFWSDSGNEVIFLEDFNHENYLHYYTLNDGLKALNNDAVKKIFPHYRISKLAPEISDDGKKILFYRQIENNEKANNKENMEVWKTEDPLIFPKMKDYEKRELQYKLTAWHPKTNELTPIETEITPTAILDINHNYAMVFDKLKYEPLYKEFPNTDVYSKNMKTGEANLVVKNQHMGPGFVTLSPYGKYIAYFKNKNWWVYDNNKKQIINLTKDLKISFENSETDRAGDVPPSGNPGWTTNDEFIILYDEFDIWLISPDGNYKNRITQGREEHIKYRINKDYRRNDHYFQTVNTNFFNTPFNIDNGVILEMSDNLHRTGYAMWNKENKIRRLIFEDKRIDGVLASEDFNHIVFMKQKFNEPPSIYGLHLKNNRMQLIYQSNPQLLNYDLGSAEQIKYKLDSINLSGTLIYPANFNPEKKYPMIVYIYEKLSAKLNVFYSPSLYGYDGFNTLKYTTNDYFVLYPDISYTIQEPGLSALKCVTTAVSKALESGLIDKDKIGLIGHSFGGYESAFIATQTNMFAAVVAGAAVTDFTSHYHSVGWNWNRPEMWRYESQQWRMGDSYYNIKNAYFQNSPLHHVEHVRTPLLLWTGKEDYQINWKQSIEMFLALKRLGKKSKMLLFENEAHVLMDKNNQQKLSCEIMDWFDTYCK